MPDAPAVATQRCDPYGAESRIQLLGGVYGPEHLGPHMWFCERPATSTYRMVCVHGHRGQAMPLCGPGLVMGKNGENFMHPGHVAELGRRGGGLCPPCAYPPAARELEEVVKAAQTDMVDAIMRDDTARVAACKQRMEDAGKSMDELIARGIIHKCPLTLVEVS